MVNRGRGHESTVSIVSKVLQSNGSIVFAFGESDNTDAYIGLVGRKVLEESVELSGRKDLQILQNGNQTVGMNMVYSSDFVPISFDWEQINERDLKFPQGVSEHYPHHRLKAIFDFKGEKIAVIAQHQSGFIRPYRRYVQSRDALFRLDECVNDGCTSFLLRDQNTYVPIEGQIEEMNRKRFKIYELTQDLKNTYNVFNLESDSGGLNAVGAWIVRNKVFGPLALRIVNRKHKLDSICMSQRQLRKVDYKTFDIDLPHLDHRIIGVEIGLKK